MIKLSLCEPYNGWRIIAPINMNDGDITLCEFEHRMNEYNQMNITFSPQFSRYKDILDSKSWGVRLQTDTLDLGFVYYKAIVRPHGLYECTLMSGVYLLGTEYLDNKDRVYKGTLSTFLNSLSTRVAYTPISGDYDIELVTGVSDNIELLNEAIRFPDFIGWIDAGLKDTGGGVMIPEVVYGDFSKIETYYEATGDERFKPVYVNNYSDSDNTDDNSIIYIDKYKVSRQYERPTLLYAYVDNGGGSAPNTRTELTKTIAPWINPLYPVIRRRSPITNKFTYYIRNPFALNYIERIGTYTYENTNNTEGQVDLDISEDYLYRRAIWYLSVMGNQDTYSIQPMIKKIALAGTLAKMDFNDYSKALDGSDQIVTTFDATRLMDNLTYNLETIYD